MAYADDLIEQAGALASVDPRRPKQASLRRAISAAYYAVFHEIVDRAVSTVLSGADAGGPVGTRLCRTIQHAAVVKAAKWFASPPADMPMVIKTMRPGAPAVEAQLVSVCNSVIELQAERHRADYDLSLAFSRADSKRLVTTAESAVNYLRALETQGDTQIFLLGCLFGDSLTKNA
jgi:hypothetical protein